MTSLDERRQMHDDFLRAWQADDLDRSFVAELVSTAQEFIALIALLATLPIRFVLSLARS